MSGILWHIFNFIIFYNFIKLFVLCDFINNENDFNDLNDSGEMRQNSEDSENHVLDSVYDTMKHNYEMKLRQNLHRLNIISDLRNKRNTNEPMNINTVGYQDNYYKNHQFDVNRKNAGTFPLGFKSPPKLIPITNPVPPVHRSDYYDDEVVGYTKCQEKPSVQTFHISDDHEHKHHPSISMVLLTGLKYLFGGFAILALPFIVLKAIFLPVKFLLFFKALALVKTFLMLTIFLRFLRFNRRTGTNNNNNRPNFSIALPGRYKTKLQTIKDILNSDEIDEETEEDYRGDDEEGGGVLSKESDASQMFMNNPFNTTEISDEFVQNLAKLIKLKSKKW